MMKVLIIEDNPNNLKLLKIVFKREGYQIIEARNGAAGVEKARREQPDLIIMDILLPDFSGLEATKKIRSLAPLKKTPIIAITSLAMAGDKQKILQAGCNGYFEKPFDPLTIVNKIQEIVGKAA